MNEPAYRILGNPESSHILIIGDHASNQVPADLELGLQTNAFEEHIAWDIGVAAVAV